VLFRRDSDRIRGDELDREQLAGDVTARYVQALAELYEAAGRPAYKTIVRRARQITPPIPVSDSSLSDWLSGKNVPSRRESSEFLIRLLLEEARRRNSRFHLQAPSGGWEAARSEAVRYRRAGQGRGGRPSSSLHTRTRDQVMDASVGSPLAEVRDPFALEVHRPIVLGGAMASDLPALPRYVARDHDAQLMAIVQRALDGESVIAVLVGGSSTGKTRACWEALAQLRQATGWRLFHPIDPTRQEATLADLSEVRPRTVLWLNDLQHYLLTRSSDLGERVAAGLRHLLRDPARAPVLILGTLWPEHWASLMESSSAGVLSQHSQARALLTGTTIRVPEAFADDRLEAVRIASVHDPRLAAALAYAREGQIAQFLAGVPALLERYANAPTAAKALIDVTIDAHRLGAGPQITRAFLEAGASGYLTDQQWDALDEQWLDHALAYAVAPCFGAAGLLTRVRPRPDQPAQGQVITYRLADYLEQEIFPLRLAMCPPASFWDAGTDHASTAHDRRILGVAAMRRGRYRHADALLDEAVRAGDRSAEATLRELRLLIGDQDGAAGLPQRQPVQLASVNSILIPIYEAETSEWFGVFCVVPDDLIETVNRIDPFQISATANGKYVASLSVIFRARAVQLAGAGDMVEATRACIVATNAGDHDYQSVPALAMIYERCGNLAAADQLRRFGLEADESIAAPWWPLPT
jgi:hypothetical protein